MARQRRRRPAPRFGRGLPRESAPQPGRAARRVDGKVGLSGRRARALLPRTSAWQWPRDAAKWHRQRAETNRHSRRSARGVSTQSAPSGSGTGKSRPETQTRWRWCVGSAAHALCGTGEEFAAVFPLRHTVVPPPPDDARPRGTGIRCARASYQPAWCSVPRQQPRRRARRSTSRSTRASAVMPRPSRAGTARAIACGRRRAPAPHSRWCGPRARP